MRYWRLISARSKWTIYLAFSHTTSTGGLECLIIAWWQWKSRLPTQPLIADMGMCLTRVLGYCLKFYLCFSEKEVENWRRETLFQASQVRVEPCWQCHKAPVQVSELPEERLVPTVSRHKAFRNLCLGREGSKGARAICQFLAEKLLSASCHLQEKVLPPQFDSQMPSNWLF